MTTTVSKTLKTALDNANPAELADALRKAKLGTILTQIDEELTLASVGVVVSLSKPALLVNSVRVTDVSGGGGTAGVYIVEDAGGTAADRSTAVAGVCLLAADGTTLTFQSTKTIKKCRVVYIPRPDTATSAAFSPDA